MPKTGAYDEADPFNGSEEFTLKQNGESKRADTSRFDAAGAATAAQAAAIATAATDATTKANGAVTTAAADATSKASTAQTNAIAAASTDATTKAFAASASAIAQAAQARPGPTTYVTPSNLKRWRKGKGRVRTGAGNVHILGVGDSTMSGAYAGALTSALCAQVQSMINYTTMPCVAGYIFPVTASGVSADPRYTMGTGWSLATQFNMGSGWAQSASGAAGALTFAVPGTWDTIEVIYYKSAGHGTSTVLIDGVAPLSGGTTIVGSGTTGLNKATFTTSLATHAALTFGGAVGGILFIAGVRCTNSTVKTCTVTNGGRGGYTSGNISTNTNPYDSQQCYAIVQPDLTLITIGINDATGATSNATYNSRLATTIGWAQTYGDVILLAPSWAGPNAPYSTLEPGYATEMASLASSLGCAFVNWQTRWTSYNQANSDGLTDATGPPFHPNGLGYSDLAESILPVLQAA